MIMHPCIYSGNGDGFFSSAFQSQLHGNALYNASMPAGRCSYYIVMVYYLYIH